MKINIVFPITNDPIGGGNQFLRSLRRYYEMHDEYSDIQDADIILFNSHHSIGPVIRIKRKYPDKIFVHRIDGPIRLYNDMSDKRDMLVYSMNDRVADATVFQSEYTRGSSIRMGCPRQKYEVVIHNGCDEDVFYKKNASDISERRIKIVASSFSDNWNKGFKTYQWLDNNLDFNRYEMTFVGRTPCEFENIRVIPLVSTKELAHILREQDIYITASLNESCSNSLIEAMSCGLPVIALNSGSSSEIICGGGFLYDNDEDIPELLDRISEDYAFFCEKVKGRHIAEAAKEYTDFFQMLKKEKDSGRIPRKKVGIFEDIITSTCEKLSIKNPILYFYKER